MNVKSRLVVAKQSVFAVGYEANYLSGDIKLGHHDKMEWVDLSSFKPEAYFTGGWLKGLQEYLNKKIT